MIKKYFILENRYLDSIVLMEISAKLSNVENVIDASVMMGSMSNMEILMDTDFIEKPVEEATPGDLVCCIKMETDVTDKLKEVLEDLLENSSTTDDEQSDYEPKTLKGACSIQQGSNLVMISIPGEHVRWEVLKALNLGLNVMLFSDNVDVETELELKQLADEKGLIVMGPDCGTSIISGVALCFANVIRQGPIGIVGASGTGIQEVTCSIDLLGGGITHAIGTGGRDLKAGIGAISMLRGIELLDEDPETKVICLISKPPDKAVADKILKRARKSSKPFVVIFLGAELETSGNIYGTTTLEEAAFKTCELSGIKDPKFGDSETVEVVDKKIEKYINKFKGKMGKIRGLFAGGTLCSEAKLILKKNNIKTVAEPAEDANLRAGTELGDGNLVLDLGDDIFTVGRPHPMIDSSLRDVYIKATGKENDVSILLMDFVGGYGSNDDPAGSLAEAINEAKRDNLLMVASYCGTEGDPQKRSEQVKKLRELGVELLPTAAQAAEFVSKIYNASIS